MEAQSSSITEMLVGIEFFSHWLWEERKWRETECRPLNVKLPFVSIQIKNK
jgi:hypothetical protein